MIARSAGATSPPNHLHRGFKGTFSSDCAPLKLGKFVVVVSQSQLALANSSARFGQQLSYSCPRGYEFSTGQLRLHAECLLGGRWSLARISNCQPRYCGPVPQIDNGFAVNATGVSYNQTATYKCYAGFTLGDDNMPRERPMGQVARMLLD